MTHTMFGHSMLYAAKTLPDPIHFTPLHSLHANEHSRPYYTSNYHSPVCVNIERLPTNFLEHWMWGLASALPDGLQHCVQGLEVVVLIWHSPFIFVRIPHPTSFHTNILILCPISAIPPPRSNQSPNPTPFFSEMPDPENTLPDTVRYLPVFWIHLFAFSHPLLYLKIAPNAVIACSCSGRWRFCTCTFIKLVACIVVHLNLYSQVQNNRGRDVYFFRDFCSPPSPCSLFWPPSRLLISRISQGITKKFRNKT